MCGRAAQTVHAAQVAAANFGVSRANKAMNVPLRGQSAGGTDSASNVDKYGNGDRDNYNMSPGMDAAVIWIENGELKTDRKV